MKRAFWLFSALLVVVMISGCDPVSPEDYVEGGADSDASALSMAGKEISEASKRIVVVAEGAQPGVWTSDIDAAAKVALEKQLPILLFFNGSDWSFAANSFVANVLLSDEWHAFAPELILVMIDLPKKSPEFPAALLERNKMLRARFNVSDFPSMIFCDTHGTAQANLRANAVMTPAEFIRDVKLCIRRLPHKVAQMVAQCGNAQLTAQYEQLKSVQTKKQEIVAQFNKQMKDCDSQIVTLSQQVETGLLEWSVSQLPADKQTQCRQAMAENAAAMKELQELMASNAPLNQENLAKSNQLRERIEKSRELINSLIVL